MFYCTILLVAVLVLLTLYITHPFLLLIYRQLRSPLRHLPGPPSPSFFMGNLREMHDQENTNLIATWEAAYGSTFVYRGFIGGCRLMTTDPVAVAHILGNAYQYPKPDFVRDSLASMAAGREGLLTVEGEDHRRQRKILTPAFSSVHIKSLTPIFWDKAEELRTILLSQILPDTPESDNTHPDTRPCAPEVPDLSDLISTSPTSISPTEAEEDHDDIDIQAGAGPRMSTGASERTQVQTRTETRIDALAWLGRATLDVIGLAGFGYAFNSLTEASTSSTGAPATSTPTSSSPKTKPKSKYKCDFDSPTPSHGSNELAQAFGIIFSTARKFRVITILQVWFPFLRRFRRNNATMIQAKATMRRIGLGLIDEKRRAIVEEQQALLTEEKGIPKEKTQAPTDRYQVRSMKGRDLLSLLIRSNLSSNPSQRMSVDEVLCQISTFLAAGHETTASAMTWCLYALAKDQPLQHKLREALRAVEAEIEMANAERGERLGGGDEHEDDRSALTDAVNKCEYLDWVVRESLRLHAPVTNTMRVCMRDVDEIPVSAMSSSGPGGYVDKNGTRKWSIPVRKWDIVSVPIQAINKSVSVWGEDAGVFRPERWAAPPQEARAIPGLYSNTLTFLNGNPLGGNRACIGYKFALIEIKIFLYTLVKDIEFSIDSTMVIEKRVNVVTRPFVKSEPHLGNQMPLNISRASPSVLANSRG